MLLIVGYLVICACVFGGFAAGGGHLAALMQPLELVMIGGAACGAFLVGNGPKALRGVLAALPTVMKGAGYSKAMYMELLALLYDILSKIRKDGLMSIENDVENPEGSALFGKYPNVLKDHHMIEFITDYLRLMVGGNLNALEIENLMDLEIETHHQEGHLPAACIASLGDGMPAFGIVAAVMGVVHTMESVGLPPAELGILIAHALVGTFLGILLAYGFVGPLASKLNQNLEESSKVFQCVKTTLLASLNGYAPAVSVEFGRKVLYSSDRPSFAELEAHVKGAR